MPIRRHLLTILLLSVVLILSFASVAEAQQQPKTCPMVVSESLTALGTNCADLQPNTSCYGHDLIHHDAFRDHGSDPLDFYIHPADRSGLLRTETIQTGPFNLPQELWGLNVMNVDANVPRALGAKGVVYVQFGGVEVENGVEPAEAVQLVDGMTMSTTQDTNLLTWPAPSIEGHASEQIAPIPSGSVVSIDAVSKPSGFLRAVFNDHAGWISTSAVDTTGLDLSGLPSIGPDDMTPMQSFYFRTGVGGTPCAQAPSVLFVQGPNNVAVDLKVFKQPIRIESSIVLRSLPPGDQLGNQLELITLTGLAILYPDTPRQIIVPPGFKSTIPLCPEFASLGIEGDADEKGACGSWTTPVALTADELGVCPPISEVPDNLLSYTVGCANIVPASGVGRAIPQLFFPDPSALDAARRACAIGALPTEICQYLGIVT